MSWYSSTRTWSYSAGDAVGERRRLLEHQRPEEQQVVVVDEIALRFAAGVLGEDADDLARELDELRDTRRSRISLDRALGVEVPRIDVVERFLLREPLFLCGRTPGCARASCIRSSASPWSMIEKSRARPASGPNWRSRRWPVAWNVPPCTLRDRRADESLGAAEHFLGGAAGEGEEEDALGRDARVR